MGCALPAAFSRHFQESPHAWTRASSRLNRPSILLQHQQHCVFCFTPSLFWFFSYLTLSVAVVAVVVCLPLQWRGLPRRFSCQSLLAIDQCNEHGPGVPSGCSSRSSCGCAWHRRVRLRSFFPLGPHAHCTGMRPRVCKLRRSILPVYVRVAYRNDENEGTDRQKLSLSGIQDELLAGVRAAVSLDTPVVLVLIHGGAVAMEYALADAVVDAFSPGIEGGEAIACALFGEAGCNRWGRLPVTIYPTTFEKNDMANM